MFYKGQFYALPTDMSLAEKMEMVKALENKFTCACGKKVFRRNFKKHLQSACHKKKMRSKAVMNDVLTAFNYTHI